MENTFLTELLGGVNELIFVKHQDQGFHILSAI